MKLWFAADVFANYLEIWNPRLPKSLFRESFQYSAFFQKFDTYEIIFSQNSLTSLNIW